MRKIYSDTRAFTLIELLTVIGIMSVLILMAVPQYGLLKNSVTLNDQAQELADALRTAQSRAITSQGGVAHGVYFDRSTNPNRYVIYGDTWSAPTYQTPYFLSGGTQILLPITNTDVSFAHLSSGRTTAVTIRIGYPSGAYKDVQVDSEGRISIL